MMNFSINGSGNINRKWIGKWYKPWTWFRFAKIITDFQFRSIDMVNNDNFATSDNSNYLATQDKPASPKVTS